MSKLTFWDTHNSEFPEEYLDCPETDKYLKAVYLLTDSGDTEEECDYGIFNCGYGDNTLNTKERFGVTYQIEPRFSSKGNPIKPKEMKVINGITMYGYSRPLRYPDKLLWVIHKERDGSTWLYKPQKLESNGCATCYGRGSKGYNVTGMTYIQIMEHCNKEGFTYKGVTDREYEENHTYVPASCRRQIEPVVWSKELDGKSVLILSTAYPKMTMREILMVLENEGASVDAAGIIHAKK